MTDVCHREVKVLPPTSIQDENEVEVLDFVYVLLHRQNMIDIFEILKKKKVVGRQTTNN